MMKRLKTFKHIHIVQKTTNGIQKCHAREPIKIVDKRTTSKDKKRFKEKNTNIICDQNSMSIIKKIKKSISDQKKPKQNNLTYTSIEKIWDLSSMRLVNTSTKNFKITFFFKKKEQLISQLLMSLRIN